MDRPEKKGIKRITEVTLIYENGSNFRFPTREHANRTFQLPGYFELDGSWHIEFICKNCRTKIYWGREEGENWHLKNLNLLHVPFSKYYTREELMDLDQLFKNTKLQIKGDIVSLKINGTTPNLALVECLRCRYHYLISFLIGIGMEERPPLPNTIGINEVVGIEDKITNGSIDSK